MILNKDEKTAITKNVLTVIPTFMKKDCEIFNQ